MPTRSLRRKALPLLLCASLFASWASAAAPRKPAAARPAPVSSGLLDRAWSFLQSLWGEEGCRLDPDGRCATRATEVQPTTDTGCMLDPSGRCHS